MKKQISISLAIFLFSVFMETGPVQAATGDIQIKLTFAAPFDDLDAHLEGPADNGLTFHVYYLNRISADGRVELDGDGYRGLNDYTETITIMRKNDGFIPGTYQYWVHDYHGDYQGDSLGITTWMDSVMVEVFQGGVLLETFRPTPERMADDNTWNVLEMTISENGIVTECDCGQTSVTGIPQIECEALVALYNNTNGENWKNNTNWNTNSECASWHGVEVYGNRVVGIHFPPPSQQSRGNRLSGVIPNELGNLSDLRTLDLSENQLSGRIPAELGNLSGLEDLNFSNNLLSGPIPVELAGLINLQSLNLSHNRLDGSIPDELGNLSNLRKLNISRNELTGSIPAALGNLTAMESLDLNRNGLEGPLPAALGNLTVMKSLDLSRNRLDGSIPAELGNLSGLLNLDLSWNRFTGPIPAELGDLTALDVLRLDQNQLEGPIPEELGNLIGLTKFNLSYNLLSGSIPSELGNLIGLRNFNLSNNLLSGSIPSELENLIGLTNFNLSNNLLSGSIPPELGNLINLVAFNVGYNRLSGSIPAELGRPPELYFFDVPANQLEGDVPSTFLTQHDTLVPTPLNLSRNMLTAAGPSMRDYLNYRQPNWAETQTIPPEDIDVMDITATGVRLTWTPIPYTGDGGYYRVCHSASPGGPYTEAGVTADKHSSGYTVANLAPATEYFFVIKTFTPANEYQQNALTSRPSEEVSAITLAGNGSSPIIITDIRGRCGEPVIIPVRIQNTPSSVSAMGFDVIFDPEILMYQGFDKGSLIPENYEFDVSFLPPNIVRCGAHKNGSLSVIPRGATGTVVFLTFETASDCRSSQIGLDNLKDDIAGWPSLPGFFTRESDRCGGDTNGDGQITPADALAVFEKFMLICPTSGGMDCNGICCDVNDDGNCTPADALCVFNAYLGRPNCLDNR